MNTKTKNQNQTKNQPTNEPTTKNDAVLFEILTVLKDIRDLLESRLNKKLDVHELFIMRKAAGNEK